MNKKIFTGLVILMGISILGIIAVQLVWMNNALKVKNELFERGVTDALNNTVIHLERIQDLGIVNEMMFSDSSTVWIENGRINSIGSIISGKHFSSGNSPIKIIREFENNNHNATIELKLDSSRTHIFEYHYQPKHIEEDHYVFSERFDYEEDMVFVSDTLHGDADSLFTISIVMIDSLESDLDSIEYAAPEFTKRVKIKTGNLKKIANRVVTEVSTWDVRVIDSALIDKALNNELDRHNIKIDFEYGIFKDSVLTNNSVGADSIKLLNSTFQTSLYPNNIFDNDIILSLYFPGQESFIYRSINWLLVTSFMFSMIILVTFALSIFYILRQKKISEMKSDFINNMTHEFKTPIATISVAADSISNDKVISNQEQVRYFAGMIKKENTRMNRQVEDILTIARLDKKEFDFNWEPINAHELIEDAIQSIAIQVEKRSGKIDIELNATNPVVTTDKFHCTNVVYNLLDNAIKYSTEAPVIKIITSNTIKGILISVSDNGIGMSKSVQGKIFERFYRQSTGNIHNVKGFGLGLSYVKAVVESNHGQISVQSEQGKGSNFDVFLPFTRL